jgi:hypothetical protein
MGRVDFMHNGRLIRVSKFRGDPKAVSYIVAVADPIQAIELIRAQAATPSDDVEDLGRVSDSLLESLRLGSGQFMAA